MIVLLTGERNAGKTTAVERTVAALEARDQRVVGFYTIETAKGLALVDARTGESMPFATLEAASAEVISVGRYHVLPRTIDHGLDLADAEGDVLVVDEIGKLERDGRGFFPLIAGFDPARFQGALFSVRKGVVGFVERHLQDGPTRVVEVTPSNRQELPRELASMLLEASEGDGGEDKADQAEWDDGEDKADQAEWDDGVDKADQAEWDDGEDKADQDEGADGVDKDKA